MSVPEFRTYWLETHAQLAKRLPGVRRYYILPFDFQKDMGDGTWMEESPAYDGVAMLWFDDREAALAAFASSAGVSDSSEFRQTAVTALTFGGDVHVIVGNPMSDQN